MWMALLIGFAGSLHCVGMCGPLMLAMIPGQGAWAYWLQYQGSRILAYGLMGLFLGSLGQGFAFLGLQKIMSIMAGVILFGMALQATRGLNLKLAWLDQFQARLYQRFKSLLPISKAPSPFLLGLMNGFLPCGLSYGALAGAWATAGAVQGFLFMVLFGLGTLPLLVLLQFSGHDLRRRLRGHWSFLQVILLLSAGLLLLYRGFQGDFNWYGSHVSPAELQCH
jgi:sulfite exporter TauE/SafE